jgi:AraC-like DNA-binding protein
MRAGVHEDIPLSRLAEEYGLSVRHFARAFRHSTEHSAHRWLLKNRVEHARELLNNRALSISDVAVALSCGFADQSHFTRVFAAMVGVSLGGWRRANGRAQDSQIADWGPLRKRRLLQRSCLLTRGKSPVFARGFFVVLQTSTADSSSAHRAPTSAGASATPAAWPTARRQG